MRSYVTNHVTYYCDRLFNKTRLKCSGSILRNCMFTEISAHSHRLYFSKFVIHFMHFNFSISYSRSYALLLVGCQISLYGPTRSWTCPSSFCGWGCQDWKSWWKIYQDVNRICGVISHEKATFLIWTTYFWKNCQTRNDTNSISDYCDDIFY